MISLFVVGGVTMCWGNVAALRQKRVKKILAWGTLAQMGGLLMGVLIWRDNSGLSAVMAYLIVLAFMNFVVFAAAGIVEWRTGRDDLADFSGLWGRSPFLAGMMTLALFSLMGLPPLAGFTVKWNLLFVLWHQGFTIPAGVMVINIFISLIYYLRIVRTLAVPAPNREKISTPILPAMFMLMGSIGFVGLFFIRNRFFESINEMLFGFFG
jgi:NADH-quinone oxidoreductase subunit N